MIPIQNTWGTEALSWYSCWYSVTEAAMYFVLSWVWALTSAQYPGLCCDKVQCHHRHPLSAQTISSSLTEHQYPIRLSSRHGQHGLSLWGWWVAPLSTKTITETLHQDDQRTHIPRLVSLPWRCTTLLPGTLSKMTINKMTFNRKVKIGSLLTAWHRYLVIDLYITIPNLRGGGERTIYTQRSPQTRETAAARLLPIWEDKEGSGLGLPTNDYYGRSFDSIKHYKLTATQQQTFSQNGPPLSGGRRTSLSNVGFMFSCFLAEGEITFASRTSEAAARPPLDGEMGD